VRTQPKNPALYPAFDDDLRQAMLDEVDAYVQEIVFRGEGTLAALLTSPLAFPADEGLAELYGLDGPAEGPVALDAAERPGLLTRAAVLTATADAADGNPIFRGLLIRERVLCEHLPAPPGDIPPLPAPAEGLGLRERVADHTSAPACMSCHAYINPPGFAFLAYDAIGAHDSSPDGLPIDSSGVLEFIGDPTTRLPFDGARDFVETLAEREEVARCFTVQWLRWALGRHEQPGDQISLDTIDERFAGTGGDVRELLVSIATSRAFLERRGAAGEGEEDRE
jgi:hypothetical protein